MENPTGFDPALPWRIYMGNAADSARFCAYSPPSQTPLLRYRAPRLSSFTYSHFPSAFPPVVLPPVRRYLPRPPFSPLKNGTWSNGMTDRELSWRTLVSSLMTRSTANIVEPFTGPPPLDHSRAFPSLARGDRNVIIDILMSRNRGVTSLRTLAHNTSKHSSWSSAGRKFFLAGIIILLLIAALRRCRRARRFIQYLLRKVLKLYRRCWRRFRGSGSDDDDASHKSSSTDTSRGTSQDHAPAPRSGKTGQSPATGRRGEEENETRGKASSDRQQPRCNSAPGSLARPATAGPKENDSAASSERCLGMPHWEGFGTSRPSDSGRRFGVRPSSFSSFERAADLRDEGRRSIGSAFRDSSGKSTSASIHRALYDFSLYIEASGNGALHQCPAPTNTNIPSCFFLPSLVSAASPSPGAEADAVVTAATGGAGAPAGSHARFCECYSSQVFGAHTSDSVCTGSACPYSARKEVPVMIFQEAIYSSDSSPPASIYQGESSLTRVTEEATGHDSGSVNSPQTTGTLTGEEEVVHPREIGELAARFRHAKTGVGSANAATDREIQMRLAEYVRRRVDELPTMGESSKYAVPEVTNIQTATKDFKRQRTTKSYFVALCAVLKCRLRHFYGMLLSLLKRLRKDKRAETPRRNSPTETPGLPRVEDTASTGAEAEPSSYFQELLRLVRLAFPRLWSYEGGCLVLLVSALVLRTFLSIWIASINGKVVQTIVQRHFGGFLRSLGILIAYALPAAVVNAAIQFFEKMLALQLRRNLTKQLTKRYLKGLTFYRVPLVDIVFLSRTLVKHLGIGAPITLVAWYALTAFAMHAIAPPLGKRTARLQELEAKYRALHGDVLHHSEEIAFYGGAQHAERRLDSAFDILYAYKQQVLMLYHLVLSSMDTLLAKHLAVVVGYAVVAGPSFREEDRRRSSLGEAHGATGVQEILWKAGAAVSGRGSAEVAITHDYIRNSSLLINLAKAVGRILMSYKDVQQLGGITARLHGFLRVLEDLEKGFFYNRDVSTGGLARRSTISTGRLRQLPKTTAVQFKDVSVVTPAGQVLLDHVSFALPSGHNLFLLGPNGCGKTSLFRVLGGLWPLLEGEITMPVASKLYYIPQRPYMPEGTLRDQVIYPMTYEDYKRKQADNDRLTDGQLEELLDTVGLSYILKRCHEGWDTWGDWEDILSGGEKQRMAFARLLFHRPVFAILDEATSAVSVDLEGALYRKCAEAKITLITISHNISLLKYHDFVLRFLGVGAPGRRWSLESTEGLKRLDSYSFLLNIDPASARAEAARVSPRVGPNLQCPAGVSLRIPAAHGRNATLLPSIPSSPSLEGGSSPRDSAEHQPIQQGDAQVVQDADMPSTETHISAALPTNILPSPTSQPCCGAEKQLSAPTCLGTANQWLTPLPSRGPRVTSPARTDSRTFTGAPSSISPAAVGSAAAEATVNTILSMRKSQQEATDFQR